MSLLPNGTFDSYTTLQEWQELGTHRANLQCMTPLGCHSVGEDNTYACDLDFFDSFLGGTTLKYGSGLWVLSQGEWYLSRGSHWTEHSGAGGVIGPSTLKQGESLEQGESPFRILAYLFRNGSNPPEMASGLSISSTPHYSACASFQVTQESLSRQPPHQLPSLTAPEDHLHRHYLRGLFLCYVDVVLSMARCCLRGSVRKCGKQPY